MSHYSLTLTARNWCASSVTDRTVAQHTAHLHWVFLGRVPYLEALELQRQLRDAVAVGRRPDTLLLLEHPPVITQGRSGKAAHVLLPPGELARRGIACVDVERGGDVTYHGPGQLVGYPIRRVGRAVRAHVTGMVEALRSYLETLGIESWWDEGSPGLWTREGKIAAVGVDARGGTTMHGFALNVAPQLDHFNMIVPCGLTKPVTSIEAALGGRAPALVQVAEAIAEGLAGAYRAKAIPLGASELRGWAEP